MKKTSGTVTVTKSSTLQELGKSLLESLLSDTPRRAKAREVTPPERSSEKGEGFEIVLTLDNPEFFNYYSRADAQGMVERLLKSVALQRDTYYVARGRISVTKDEKTVGPFHPSPVAWIGGKQVLDTSRSAYVIIRFDTNKVSSTEDLEKLHDGLSWAAVGELAKEIIFVQDNHRVNFGGTPKNPADENKFLFKKLKRPCGC